MDLLKNYPRYKFVRRAVNKKDLEIYIKTIDSVSSKYEIDGMKTLRETISDSRISGQATVMHEYEELFQYMLAGLNLERVIKISLDENVHYPMAHKVALRTQYSFLQYCAREYGFNLGVEEIMFCNPDDWIKNDNDFKNFGVMCDLSQMDLLKTRPSRENIRLAMTFFERAGYDYKVNIGKIMEDVEILFR